MARLRAAAVLLGLVASLVLVAGCGGSSAVAVPTTLDGLADSAKRSSDASTGRFAYAMTMSVPPLAGELELTGEGSFDTAVGKTEMTFDLSSFLGLLGGLGGTKGLDADDFRMSAVLDGLVMYLRLPFLDDKLPGGKTWMKVDLQQAASRVPGLDLEQLVQFANNGPQSTLDYLRAVSGEIETVGAEKQRGVATTHYRTRVDLVKYAKLVPAAQREQLGSLLDELTRQTGLRQVPVDVWVGEDGLVRRFEMTMTMAQPGSAQTASAAMTYELYDYGEPVQITLPLPDDTVDITELR